MTDQAAGTDQPTRAANDRPLFREADVSTAQRAVGDSGGASAAPRPERAENPKPTPRAASLAPAASARSTESKPALVRGHRTRKARLRLARIDPWSVMKTAFLFAIAGGIMFWVAVYVVWSVIEASGLFQAVNETVGELVNASDSGEAFRVENYVTANKVLGLAAVLAGVNVVLGTALATLGSFLYNLSATMLGGLEITLAED